MSARALPALTISTNSLAAAPLTPVLNSLSRNSALLPPPPGAEHVCEARPFASYASDTVPAWPPAWHDTPFRSSSAARPGPGGPCGPAGPAGPAGPVAPRAPSAPRGPRSPAGPEGPCRPAGPVAPVGPVAPRGPATFQEIARSPRRHWPGPLTIRTRPPALFIQA